MGVATESVFVEMRNRLDGSWSDGYIVIETVETAFGACYRLRRISDGHVLWGLYLPDEVAITDRP
jgi:hypothetical protein